MFLVLHQNTSPVQCANLKSQKRSLLLTLVSTSTDMVNYKVMESATWISKKRFEKVQILTVLPFGELLSTRMYTMPNMAFNFLLEIQNILDGCLKPIKILMRLICNSYKEKLQHSGERNEQNLNLKLNKNITTKSFTNSLQFFYNFVSIYW